MLHAYLITSTVACALTIARGLCIAYRRSRRCKRYAVGAILTPATLAAGHPPA